MTTRRSVALSLAALRAVLLVRAKVADVVTVRSQSDAKSVLSLEDGNAECSGLGGWFLP